MAQLHFTSAPVEAIVYRVGDKVEVYCDHDNAEGDRVRGWLAGIAVQVDNKLVAVQFQENVYLTDGWMVPDHVLWLPKDSKNLRPYTGRRRRAAPR
ncbi:MAG: hypothetical protein OHK0052_13600 [Anaerolineales bacterium]